MINAQDIKNGTCIRMDGRLYFCVEFLHVKTWLTAAFSNAVSTSARNSRT